MTLTFIPQRSRSTLVQAERDALEVLYDAYNESLYNSVFRKMVALGYSRERSRELTGKIIQEVWAEVWKNRRSLKTASFEAYLRDEIKTRVFRQGPAEGCSEKVYSDLQAFSGNGELIRTLYSRALGGEFNESLLLLLTFQSRFFDWRRRHRQPFCFLRQGNKSGNF